ncbi:MAG TPA: rhomboid family intramembrane serine protease, partial [Planctomycetota bacterium]|nr:rhomboid family intramembrane serine protease [Planctomycetota bacterium]
MAFRPHWYDDERRSNPFGFRPSTWSGFRWIFTLTLAAFVLELLTIRSFPEPYVWGSLRAWWVGPEGLGFNFAFPVQLLSYALLHDPQSLSHVGWNLFYLWMFAPELEAESGRAGLLRLYV